MTQGASHYMKKGYMRADIEARRSRLLEHLQTGRLFTTQEMMDLLNTTRQTIWCDIKNLRERGFNIGSSRGSGGGFMLRPRSRLWEPGKNREGD
jgi:predicted DNA-binding transcriptional regulator YafY